MILYKESRKAIVTGFSISTLASLLFGTFMVVANIPATTILPTLAPTWIGLATITIVASK
ncbi:MAG TPA: hypothetical protein HA224_00790 [Nanoarchaeota archaeon]|nr:hypothetical protein [Nanoarchaeota archaeon]